MSIFTPLDRAIEEMAQHYQQRLGSCTVIAKENEDHIKNKVFFQSDKLREGNYARIFHYGHKTEQVIVITHGLSDSPYFVKEIARCFYNEGLNVIMPLLPAHGLKDPDFAVQDKELDTKWRKEIDQAVNIAGQLGSIISLAGFSAGGALSYNKVLRSPDLISGGLFLFSAAIDLGSIAETSARIFFVQSISKIFDGKYTGLGRNPFKYGSVPSFCGIELAQVIKENDQLAKNKKLKQHVFVAQSIIDDVVKLPGLLDLVKNKAASGAIYMIAENVAHAEITLKEDVPLDLTKTGEPKVTPKANPQFDLMMESCIQFFNKKINSTETKNTKISV